MTGFWARSELSLLPSSLGMACHAPLTGGACQGNQQAPYRPMCSLRASRHKSRCLICPLGPEGWRHQTVPAPLQWEPGTNFLLLQEKLLLLALMAMLIIKWHALIMWHLVAEWHWQQAEEGPHLGTHVRSRSHTSNNSNKSKQNFKIKTQGCMYA